MNQQAFKSIIDSFIQTVHVCDYCNDSSMEDTFSHIEEAQNDYHETLCDTCYSEHRRNDSFNR